VRLIVFVEAIGTTHPTNADYEFFGSTCDTHSEIGEHDSLCFQKHERLVLSRAVSVFGPSSSTFLVTQRLELFSASATGRHLLIAARNRLRLSITSGRNTLYHTSSSHFDVGSLLQSNDTIPLICHPLHLLKPALYSGGLLATYFFGVAFLSSLS
jgi:hypothetical protein